VKEVASPVPREHPGAGTLLARGEAGKDSAPGGIGEGSKRGGRHATDGPPPPPERIRIPCACSCRTGLSTETLGRLI
jgi:hypothetical protein